MKAKVLEAIKKSAAVPSIPQVVARFLEIMQDPDYSYSDLVKVLSSDPGTVSEILRLANSALFGIRNKVVCLQQALTLLGPKRLRSLVLGRYLVDSIAHRDIPGLDMRYFWRRSLASAVVAGRLAEQVRLPQREEAFVAALLADIGVPILAETFPKAYAVILSQFAPDGAVTTPEQEIDAVDVTHSDVSTMVLYHWDLPELICQAVNLQHSAAPGDKPSGRIARVLSSADRLAKLLCDNGSNDGARAICQEAIAFIDIDAAALIELLPMFESDIEELASALRIDVMPSSAYAAFLQSLHEWFGLPIAASTGTS